MFQRQLRCSQRPIRILLLLVLYLCGTERRCNASVVLYESAALGPTGGNTGFNVDSQFLGVRFQVNSPVVTTEIGGHFSGSGNFFGAIVQLSDFSDFPDSLDLSTSDVLGHALLTFPALSAEVTADLSVDVAPGTYGLVFGSVLFGATGAGVANSNNNDIGSPSWFFRDSTPPPPQWKEALESGTRFFVKAAVPECDFDGDFACGLSDVNMMFSQGDLTVGVPTTAATDNFDLIDNNSIDDADITEWLRLSGANNGYGGGDPNDSNAPFLRGDTDGLDEVDPNIRTVDITDFQNFLIGFTGSCATWECGNFNGDNDVDTTDFSNHFLPSFIAAGGSTYGPGQAIPEPTTFTLASLSLLGLLSFTWRWNRRLSRF